MKTDYVFGDRVKVLPKLDETTGYTDKVNVGNNGFVLNNNGSTFPVEVQFVGYSEVFMYEELEFLNSNIKEDIMNNSFTLRLDISNYCCESSKDYIGVFTTAQLLQDAVNSLSIDLKDQFCCVNDFISNKTARIILITASDKSIVDEVVYQFEKNVNTHNLTIIAKHFMKHEFYQLAM